MKRIMLLLSAAMSLWPLTGVAQTDVAFANQARAVSEDTFYDLAEKKAKLVVKIQTLPGEIRSFQEEKIPAAQLDEQLAEELKTKLKSLQTREAELTKQQKNEAPATTGRPVSVQANAATLARAQSISEELSKVQAEIELLSLKLKPLSRKKSVQALQEELDKKRAELTEAQKELDLVQGKILRITTPEQSFKRQISGYSSILIGVVILGFFGIAAMDYRVRRSVFAGQAGIQFLALFSIVIAIILFGITGILGGNELSALLGSISGYILGKVTSPDTKAGSAPTQSAIGSAPQGLQGGPGGTGEIEASCAPVAGAQSYVWYAKRAGSDTFDRAKSTPVSHARLTGFGAGESVEIKVGAANAAGEGPTSEAVTATAG
jgi:hypothetical protein